MSSIRKKKSKNALPTKPRWYGHDYQRYCVGAGFSQKFLAFFLDPGLGKTTIILQLFKMLRLYGKVEQMLVIAPIRVCYLVWPLEVAKWANFEGLTVNVMHGTKKDLWSNVDADIHIINPEGLPWLKQQLKGKRKKDWPFQMLTVDESTLFKSYDSARFKNLKNYFISEFDRRYILTGTPIPNGYMQLFSQMQLVDQGRSLGTKIGYYRACHFTPAPNVPLEYNQWVLRENEDEVINRRISKYVIRLSAEDHLDMPEKIDNVIEVELPKKVMKQYKQLKKDMFLMIKDKEVFPPTAASVGQKLHQMCNGNLYEDWDVLEKGKVPPAKKRPYFKLHKEKIKALEELIAELNGKPLFVTYWYHHELIELQKHFKSAVILNSKTSEKQVIQIEKDWNTGRIPLLIVQPASVAHGLNFQKAGGDICWYSLIYDFEIYDQCVRRLWRQGATAMVRNHFLVAKGCIDEVILKKLQGKQDDQNLFFSILEMYQKDY